MTKETRNATLPREPDGTVGQYHFWLGDMFETEEDDDDSDLGDDAEADEGSFGRDRD